MEQLGMLLNKNPNLYLLSDEVYEYITFEKQHLSAHLYDSLRSRSIIVSSFGKTLHVTGWKMGYLIAEKKIMDEIKKIVVAKKDLESVKKANSKKNTEHSHTRITCLTLPPPGAARAS